MIIPNTYFITILKIPYFFVCIIFLIVPTDVPVIITKKLYPIEYISSKMIPQTRLPFPATSANKTTKTGVAQGEEKIPPNIPAINAPI